MKSPIILEGQPFVWPKPVEVVNEDGDVNWQAAAFADPGVMSCPHCNIFLWREGTFVECPTCGGRWHPK